MKWMDYREKLGICFSDTNKAKMLASNIATFVYHSETNSDYNREDYYRFCLMVGLVYNEPYPFSIELYRLFQNPTMSISEILSYYIAFVNTKHGTKQHKKLLIDTLAGFMDDLNIPYEIINDQDGFFIFPKGAKELDDALVSEPLEWLKQYPESEKAWVKALKSYVDATEANASDVADLFRKTLEAFFQEFFKGKKALENYKKSYGDYLKGKGVPAEISNNLEALLQAYANFMNNYAKHRDATSDKVLEYLMYQTGNIIRLLITLEGQP